MTKQEMQPQIRRIPNYYRLSTTEEQALYTPRLSVILSLIGVLHTTMYDLIDAMQNAGIYRHRAKVDVNNALEYTERLHGVCYDVVASVDKQTARSYNDCYQALEGEISEAVLIAEPLIRTYSIAMALCRLIIKINETQMGRFKLPMIEVVKNAQKRLNALSIEDKCIDVIIDNVVERKCPKML